MVVNSCRYGKIRYFTHHRSHCLRNWLPVISYPGHFVPTLFNSYLLFGHFVPSNNNFVPRSFRTHFGHFVPSSAGYEKTIWWSIRTQVISYLFGHFVPILVIWWMDGWIDERADVFWLKRQINVLLLIVTKWNSLSFFNSFNNCQTLLPAHSNTSK